jgi:hypothetical protein
MAPGTSTGRLPWPRPLSGAFASNWLPASANTAPWRTPGYAGEKTTLTVQLSPAVKDMLTAQVRGVTAKSRFGEPPVSPAKDVSMPPLWAVNETVTGRELAPTVVVPEKVSGVVEIWPAASAACTSIPMTTKAALVLAAGMFEPTRLVSFSASYRRAAKHRSWLEGSRRQ